MADDTPSRILNVDSRAAIRDAKTRCLQRAGFVVQDTASGQAALRLVREDAPALVLLAGDLPELNSIDVCWRIKQDPTTAATIVVQMSAALAATQEGKPDLQGGADGYLADPIQPEELIATINSLLRVRRAEEALQSATDAFAQHARELQRSQDDLQQFVYAASHDLQEPVRLMCAYARLLAQHCQNTLDAETEHLISYLEEGATHAQQVLQDLLEYAQVVTKGKPFTVIQCDDVLTRTCLRLQPQIEECGAVITAAPLPAVSADAAQLQQVFQHLLSNALKFHGAQPPRVHISATLEEERRQWVFAVRDEGIGVAPQFAERIFVIFQRLHTRDEFPGTGLGLALCKRILERHGGRIWVESEPGAGATFFFTLPRG